MPGRIYGIHITGTTSSNVKLTRVRVFVGGTQAYLPLIEYR
jgi:hypothetical protein